MSNKICLDCLKYIDQNEKIDNELDYHKLCYGRVLYKKINKCIDTIKKTETSVLINLFLENKVVFPVVPPMGKQLVNDYINTLSPNPDDNVNNNTPKLDEKAITNIVNMIFNGDITLSTIFNKNNESNKLFDLFNSSFNNSDDLLKLNNELNSIFLSNNNGQPNVLDQNESTESSESSFNIIQEDVD